MPPQSDRALLRRDNVLFVLCVILSGLLLLRPEFGQRVTGTIRGTVLWPFLRLQEWSEAGRTSRAAFDRLRAERDSATHAAQFLPSLRAENQRLRALLGLGQRLKVPYVSAEVLHQSLPTDGRTLLLSAGERQGVKAFDPVIGADGLVGVVREVGRDRSLAWTWLHPEFRASAYTVPGAVFGVVAPALQVTGSELLLQLRGVAIRDTIPDGTLVVTSGLGGVFPQGIPVGTVLGAGQEETGWEKVYILRPAASPAEASQVLILRAPEVRVPEGAFDRDTLP